MKLDQIKDDQLQKLPYWTERKSLDIAGDVK